MHTCISVYRMCEMATEARRQQHQVPRDWRYKCLVAVWWGLGLEPWSSKGTAISLNHWVTSTAPTFPFIPVYSLALWRWFMNLQTTKTFSLIPQESWNKTKQKTEGFVRCGCMIFSLVWFSAISTVYCTFLADNMWDNIIRIQKGKKQRKPSKTASVFLQCSNNCLLTRNDIRVSCQISWTMKSIYNVSQ